MTPKSGADATTRLDEALGRRIGPDPLIRSYTFVPQEADSAYWPGVPRAIPVTRQLTDPLPGALASEADVEAVRELPRMLAVAPAKYPTESAVQQSPLGYTARLAANTPRQVLLHEATHAGGDMIAEGTGPFGIRRGAETAAMASEVQEAMRQGATVADLEKLNPRNAQVPGWVYDHIKKHGPKFDGTPADVRRARDFGKETSEGQTVLGRKFQDFLESTRPKSDFEQSAHAYWHNLKNLDPKTLAYTGAGVGAVGLLSYLLYRTLHKKPKT